MDRPEHTQRWLEAGKRLAQDPTAPVACPNCGAMLDVRDVPWLKDPTYFERYLSCSYCGAVEVLRMRRDAP